MAKLTESEQGDVRIACRLIGSSTTEKRPDPKWVRAKAIEKQLWTLCRR